MTLASTGGEAYPREYQGLLCLCPLYHVPRDGGPHKPAPFHEQLLPVLWVYGQRGQEDQHLVQLVRIQKLLREYRYCACHVSYRSRLFPRGQRRLDRLSRGAPQEGQTNQARAVLQDGRVSARHAGQ